MNKKAIKENFEKFNIPKENILIYQNPRQFAGQFKKCSILKYGNTSYSDTSLSNLKKDKQ